MWHTKIASQYNVFNEAAGFVYYIAIKNVNVRNNMKYLNYF